MAVVVGTGFSIGSANHAKNPCPFVLVMVGSGISCIVGQKRPMCVGQVIDGNGNDRSGTLLDQGMVLDKTVRSGWLGVWDYVRFAVFSPFVRAQKLV